MDNYKSTFIEEKSLKIEISREMYGDVRYETVSITHIPSKIVTVATCKSSQVKAYNEALRSLEDKLKNEILINALADMLFAYTNKDEDFPHDFEIKTINETIATLKMEYKGSKYTEAFFEKVRLEELY